MRTTKLIAAGLLALAGQLLAGGFYLQLGNPEANPEARKANAVLVVKATGCHDAAAAQLTAKAIGVVNGKRQSIPLSVTKLSEPGAFALAQQWPKDGKWVIHLEGRESGRLTFALVPAGGDGPDRLHARFEMNALPAGAVEAMLQ
jgi:hypothetical protein